MVLPVIVSVMLVSLCWWCYLWWCLCVGGVSGVTRDCVSNTGVSVLVV